MIYEVEVATDPMRLALITVHVDADNIVRAIEEAEKHVEGSVSASPDTVFTVGARETGITRILSAK